MIAKKINTNQLKEAIKVAFSEDAKIVDFYDPHKKIEEVDDIVTDISKKICEFKSGAKAEEVEIKGIYEKGNLIGYYVFKPSLLISFSLNIQYRTRPFLNAFWGLIKRDMNSRFNCFLWSKNVRAIKFLQKRGMRIMQCDNLITKLTCQ